MCKSAGEAGVGGEEDMLNVQRERRLRGPVCGTLSLHFSAKEAGIPGAHSFNKYLLRDFFVLVSMPGALITQFLPIAAESWQQMEFRSGGSSEGL